jgi:hypothetical protein
MQEFLNQVYQHVGPEVEKAVSTQFKLSPDQAKKVLPEVAPTVANELKKKLEAPAANPELLAGFKNLLGATNASQPALMEMAGKLAPQLLGAQKGQLETQLSKKIGVDGGMAQKIVGMVVPTILTFLTSRAKAGDLSNLLGSLLGTKGGSLGALTGLLGLGGEGSTAESVMGSLGGLLGGKR